MAGRVGAGITSTDRDVLSTMKWKDQAALVFGFFQMVGYNRYQLGGKTVDFIEVLERLDRGWGPSPKARAQLTLSLSLTLTLTRALTLTPTLTL